jgi:hypothetical protein
VADGIITCRGPARGWYRDLVRQVLAEHVEVPCRQGRSLESPDALSVIVPGAANVASALAGVDLPRRGEARARTTFSVLNALRRFLGYPESVLHDRFPILAKYARSDDGSHAPRAIACFTEFVPPALADAPWVSRVDGPGGGHFLVDQVLRAACLLANSPTTRRALVDFGEGHKSRCMLHWLFTIRDGALRLHQSMRSNDLVVGMPNDLIDGRIAQLIMAAIVGAPVGDMHHHAAIVQVYRRDMAGVDCVAELVRMDLTDVALRDVEDRLRTTAVVAELAAIVEPWIHAPLESRAAAVERWRTILDGVERMFWRHNTACRDEQRGRVRHLIGRYGGG